MQGDCSLQVLKLLAESVGQTGAVPRGHWKTITLVAGLRHDAIVAHFVIDGLLDGKIFRTYIERCLAPTLDRGDIVFMDNLQTHKVAGVTEAIEAADAMAIYLPAYSPDLNPIEQIDTLSAGIGHPLVARETDQLIRLSTGALSTPPSPAVGNHRIAVRLALEMVSALHRIPHHGSGRA
jgi:hypothetical protein